MHLARRSPIIASAAALLSGTLLTAHAVAPPRNASSERAPITPPAVEQGGPAQRQAQQGRRGGAPRPPGKGLPGQCAGCKA